MGCLLYTSFNRYHQTCKDESTYLLDLRKLQYDQLYGEHYVTGGEPAYEPTDMKMGVRPIRVTGYIKLEETWYLAGENFTPYSKATVNEMCIRDRFVAACFVRCIVG